MTSKNAISTWDFTIGKEYIELEYLLTWCKENCKKYCFQLEKGVETGFEHYQGRISLKVKTRKIIGELDNKCHWSPTSKVNQKNDFYVMKKETRIKGPWKDTDSYIPKQVRDIELWPWQQQILDDSNNWNTRSINIVICPEGNIGKSTLSAYAGCRNLARSVPIMENYKDLMRFVMNTPKSRLYLVDFPRSLNKTSSHSFWSAIETIKNGYCWDDRYEFREEYFDCPNIWVFCNSEICTKYLSKDRWVFWDVIKDEQGGATLYRRKLESYIEGRHNVGKEFLEGYYAKDKNTFFLKKTDPEQLEHNN